MNTNNPFNLYTNIDMAQYQLSPSRSPAEASKNAILSLPVKSESRTASLLPAQNMSGPSFDYESYQQNTGLVAGSIANTYAINQSLYGNGYVTSDNLDFNFNSSLTPRVSSFDSPISDVMDAVGASPVRQTVDPSRLSESEASQSMLVSSNMRVYNGYHTNQAAQAAQSKVKVEAQQVSQQRILQQQRQVAQSATARPRVQPSEDALVNETITQVLNNMRQQESSNMDMHSPDSPTDAHRGQSRDLDDMDEDERLLNSEEGKRLTPKERRQLRNKVSARHFRKRRKEMIVDLEVVNQALSRENEQLKMENKKVIAEYQNMRKFVAQLLATPHFSHYVQDMQEQALGLGTPQTAIATPQTTQPRQRQRSQQARQFSMPMIPEQNQPLQLADVLTEDALFNDDSMNDFGGMNMLSQNSSDFDMFSENTGIFAVLDTPSPAIDISALSGKTTNIVGHQEEFVSDEEKVEIAPLEKGPAPIAQPAVAEKAQNSAVVDAEFDNDPAFALYHDQPGAADAVRSDEPVEFDTEGLSHVDIFGGIEPEKVFERYQLVDASEEEVGAALAMERVQRICSSVEDVATRLDLMTINL